MGALSERWAKTLTGGLQMGKSILHQRRLSNPRLALDTHQHALSRGDVFKSGCEFGPLFFTAHRMTFWKWNSWKGGKGWQLGNHFAYSRNKPVAASAYGLYILCLFRIVTYRLSYLVISDF